MRALEAVPCAGCLLRSFSQGEASLNGRAELNAARVERRAILAFQPDHVESPATLMVAVPAQVACENVGSGWHRHRVTLVTETLEVRVHIGNAA